jgi:cytochrome c551/c552
MSYRKLFYIANFLLLGVFFWAIVVDYAADWQHNWKHYQGTYYKMAGDELDRQADAEKDSAKAANLHAQAKAMRNSPVFIRQVIVSDLNRYDRCTTCHVAMDEYTNPTMKTPKDWPNPYKGHPKVDEALVKAHPFTKFGCTTCHQGQGLATTAEAAHGHVLHWENPMLSVKDHHIEGSCVKCHGNFETLKGAEVAAKGRALFKQHGCYGCHAIDGWGQTISVGLEDIADKPFERIAGYNYDRVRIDGKALPESEWNIQNWILAHLTNDPQHVTPNDPFAKLNAEPIPPSGMANFSGDEHTAPEISRADADAIVAYLSGMTKVEQIPYRWHVPAPKEVEPQFADAKAHGHYVFQKYGCAGCHGLDAKQGRRRFNALGAGQAPYDEKMPEDALFANMSLGREPTLPDLMGTYSHDELVKKIANGVAAADAKKWDPKGPLPMVFMPVWKDKISKKELDDLATWLLSTAKKDESGF